MIALRKLKPGFGAELVEIEKPKIKSTEVLVKVQATSICGTDVHIYEWDKWSQSRIRNLPQTMGHEFTGIVTEAGKDCKKLKEGDVVSVETHIPCMACKQCLTGQMHVCNNLQIVGVDRDGSMAEYITIPEIVGWKNDPSTPPELLSIQEPLGNAVYCTLVEPVHGKSVVIFGDGPIALFAVGVARVSGASKIIIVGLEDFRLNIAKKMGADYTFNAKKDNHIVSQIIELCDGIGADVVLEMAGAEIAVKQGFKVLRKGGRFSFFGLFKEEIKIDINDDIVFKGATMYGINGRLMFDTWFTVSNLLKSGRLDVSPVITHKLSLENYQEGFELMMETPKKVGKVVLIP